jgi:hypothetical protein
MAETTTGNKKWYVIRAISGKEKKVKQYIESEIIRTGLQDYIAQVLIPMEKYYQIKDGKKISKERSYFPGYILLEAEFFFLFSLIFVQLSTVRSRKSTLRVQPCTTLPRASSGKFHYCPGQYWLIS